MSQVYYKSPECSMREHENCLKEWQSIYLYRRPENIKPGNPMYNVCSYGIACTCDCECHHGPEYVFQQHFNKATKPSLTAKGVLDLIDQAGLKLKRKLGS